MGKYSVEITETAKEDMQCLFRTCNKESIKKIVKNIVHIFH